MFPRKKSYSSHNPDEEPTQIFPQQVPAQGLDPQQQSGNPYASGFFDSSKQSGNQGFAQPNQQSSVPADISAENGQYNAPNTGFGVAADGVHNPYGMQGQQQKPRKSKKKWIIAAVVVVLGLFAITMANSEEGTSNTTAKQESASVTVEKTNPSPAVDNDDALQPRDVAVDSNNDGADANAAVPTTQAAQSGSNSKEQKKALKKAELYLKTGAFSKAGLYRQLTSEYGENFDADAAQYAVDNVKVDWNEQALKSAHRYEDVMNMSSAEIYEQLVSEYGEQFTPEEAQYAIDHLND